MTGINKVILVGNLGADPKISIAGHDQKKVASFQIATSESWRDKATGERKEQTEWHRVVIYNEALAKVAEQYLKKGSRVYLEGKQSTRKLTDNAGVERYITETVLGVFNSSLVLLDRKENAPAPAGEDSGGAKPEFDDEIPF
jgi:single-strand DNA-binding protein